MGVRLPFLIALVMLSVVACGGSKNAATGVPDATLENTYWKLVRLGDTAVTTPEGGREIQITLAADGRLVHGYAGCNQMSGSYTVDGASLRFGAIAMTRMACAHGMEIEAKLAAALDETRRWKISGNGLELFGEAGPALASFEAVYLR